MKKIYYDGLPDEVDWWKTIKEFFYEYGEAIVMIPVIIAVLTLAVFAGLQAR